MEQPPSASAESVRTRDKPAVVVPLFVLIAAIGGMLGSFTIEANLLVLAVGGTLTWAATTGRTRRRPAPARLGRGAIWWSVPLTVFALIELVTFGIDDAVNYPTLSLLADPMLEHYLVRAACYFGWLTAFWGLTRR